MENKEKRFGIGTLSLVIFVFAFMFTSLNINTDHGTYKFGEIIMNNLKINIEYNFVTIALLFFSIYIGNKYKQYYLAMLGKLLSIVLLSLFIIFIFLGIIQNLI